MIFATFFLAFVSLTSAGLSTHDPYYCYATDPIQPQRSMFSTNTQLDNVRGNGLNMPRISSCTPTRFWTLYRGGSRLPDVGQMNTMRNFDPVIRARLNQGINSGRADFCREDRDNLISWSFNASMTDDRALELTETGWEEVGNAANRFQTVFPQVLPPVYNQAQFQFRHTFRERTNETALAFARGLFGHENVVLDDVPVQDRLLRPMDSCNLYSEWANNNIERDAFREGVDFLQMMDQVNKKLGLIGSNHLSLSELLIIVNYCRFEQKKNPREPSPWCAAFSIANQAVLEYADDLGNYYSSGYGGDESLFRNMNCHLMQNLIQFFQADSSEEQIARIFVSHASVIRFMLVTLGVFRNEARLTRHNFAQQTTRNWVSSRISSMATNFAFIHHTCEGDEDNDIVIYFNEHPLLIPGCEAPGLCKQQTFINLFQRFVNANCDELFCSRST